MQLTATLTGPRLLVGPAAVKTYSYVVRDETGRAYGHGDTRTKDESLARIARDFPQAQVNDLTVPPAS